MKAYNINKYFGVHLFIPPFAFWASYEQIKDSGRNNKTLMIPSSNIHIKIKKNKELILLIMDVLK